MSQSLSNLAARRPLTFSVVVVLIPLVSMLVLDAGMAALNVPELNGRLAIEAVFAGYVAVVLTRLAWWREAGFRRPEVTRRLWATVPLFSLPLIVLAGSGIEAAPVEQVLGFVLFTILVAFAEEGLVRGVVLRALTPTGLRRAVLTSAAIFGLGHLANIPAGASVSMTAVQVLENTFLGIAFAGLCLYVGSIWPAVVLHASLDLADVAGRGFAFPPTQPVTAPVLVPIVLTALCALYGWWLLRRAIRNTVEMVEPTSTLTRPRGRQEAAPTRTRVGRSTLGERANRARARGSGLGPRVGAQSVRRQGSMAPNGGRVDSWAGDRDI